MNPVDYKLPAADFKRTINVVGGINQDIISVLHKDFPIAVGQTREFAKRFETQSRLHSALKIWRFLKSRIKYVKDDEQSQDIRLPSSFIADGE
jgi:hypothetical protein